MPQAVPSTPSDSEARPGTAGVSPAPVRLPEWGGRDASSAALAEDALAARFENGGPPAEETRERILDLARDLLLRRSFHSFSYQDLADGIGIRKASIHYYFPGKEDLGIALVERIGEKMHRWAKRLDEEGVSPESKLGAFLQVQRRLLGEGDRICVYGVLGAEFNALPPRMQAAYTKLLEGLQKWLTGVLREGRERGALTFDGSPEEMAMIVSSTVQGALQIARASRRPDRFDAVVGALESRLRSPAMAVPPVPGD